MQNIQKLNLRGPRTSNISLKFIASPFSNGQIDGEDFVNFCGLLRKHEPTKRSHPIMTNFLPYPFTFVALRRYSSGVHLDTNSVYIFDNLHSIKLSTDHRPFWPPIVFSNFYCMLFFCKSFLNPNIFFQFESELICI